MNQLYTASFLLFFLVACKNKTPEQQEQTNDYIEITKDQIHSQNMKIGSPKKTLIEERILFSGKIISTIDGAVKVNAPVEGVVKQINVYQGQTVKNNDPLLKIGGMSLIELQQKFATSSAKMNQLKTNYERAKKLYDEDIKTENEFMLAESEYMSELASYKALVLELQQIGLNISKIENGDYVSTYTIKSPITGQISGLNVLPGQYINSETEIAEIVNKNKVELQLSFFENDYPKLKLGQTVFFNNLSNSNFSEKATITRIGSKLSTNSNTLECYASISNETKKAFAINQIVHGEVIVASDSVLAIPKLSVLSQENNNYIITITLKNENSYQLKKQKVEIGKSDKENVELLDIDKNILILLSGFENIAID